MTPTTADASSPDPWVFDGHNDLPTALRATAGYSVAGLDAERPELQTDLPRLRRGGVGAQFWSAWTPSTLTEPEALLGVLEQIDAVQRLVAAYPAELDLAYTADEVEQARAEGRIASLIGVEGGHAIASSLGVLRQLARLGIRYLTLTHNDNTSWADSGTDEPNVGGLNDDGRAVIAALNRHGILVDLSHTSPETQRQAFQVTTAPVLFSHSSVKGVTNHPRNVENDVLDLLPSNGGVLQLTFVPYFVSSALADWSEAFRRAQAELDDGQRPSFWKAGPRPATPYGTEVSERPQPSPALTQWLESHPKPVATIEDVVAHISYARDRVGIDHLGLGGDYDGVDVQPQGLEDVAGYPRLFEALRERGWSADELERLAWRNVLRVLRDAEDAAAEPLWPSR